MGVFIVWIGWYPLAWGTLSLPCLEMRILVEMRKHNLPVYNRSQKFLKIIPIFTRFRAMRATSWCCKAGARNTRRRYCRPLTARHSCTPYRLTARETSCNRRPSQVLCILVQHIYIYFMLFNPLRTKFFFRHFSGYNLR